MSEDKKTYQRRNLNQTERSYLWMKSGGICSFEGCNKRLVVSTEGLLTNQGIIAHIIGHKGPRHEYMEKYDYNIESLEDVSNLMLMCYKHSKLIDDSHTKDQFPPGRLFEMKKKHEQWVDSWSESEQKKSIALIHKRLGTPITDIEYEGDAPYILIEAIENQDEFIDFTPEGWEEGKTVNLQIVEKFKQSLRNNDANVAEIFPLSPIPLLIHMGFLLTDTMTLHSYQFDREQEKWIGNLSKGEKEKIILFEEDRKINGESELAVMISISATVALSDVNESLNKDFDYFSIRINDPNVKRIIYQNEVKKVQSKIKSRIENIIQETSYEKIHLFYAGPAGLAIEIGRGINPRMWGEVCLYQYDRRQKPHYEYALSLT